MEVAISQTIKGYELQDRIGAGNFGTVYRAYQTTVGREVAIKVILPGLANQPEFIRRFECEAQIVARLEHPHITPLYDYWRDPAGAYLVMRWLRGGSLRDALENGALELRAAALLLDQIAGALSLAHRNDVIHRDIKPGNILLDEDSNAYLTDFGIAKDLNLPSANIQQDAIVGSLDYIAPEQARSEPVTPRTDIYSLGVTMFEVITGHHPFNNFSPNERLYKHINDPLPEITDLEPRLQVEVNRVIQKATAKHSEYRYPDALAFAADFREVVGLNRVSTSVVELLTQREHEVLQLIIDGLSNKDIAQRLTITVGTVKWYVNQIFSKMGVRSRVQAIVRARELSLIVKPGEAASTVLVPTEDFRPENPYKGLRAFQSADYQDFFGREKVTAKLIQRIGEAGEYSRFLAVIGPSGSGKSSLVKAGLIPALWRGDLPSSEKWFVVEMLPGAHPLDELEIALTKVAANQAPNMREHLERDARGLLRIAQLILPHDTSELVLVIDQFEEAFTLLEDEAARSHFLDMLYTAVTEPRSRVRVIVTLRADFYDRPLHYPYFGELVRTRLETIMPLAAAELERAITSPAQRAGVTFEPGLVSGIIADVNYQPGALPLLQYALTELFEQRQGRILTREAYQELGGTIGALAKRTEEVYLSLDETEQEVARQMFLRLVTLGEGAEDTRRRTPRSELQAIAADSDVMDNVIDSFASYRLLSLDTDPGTRSPTVEVAHEALLREWERLRAWLNESRDEIKLQRQLSSMAEDWQHAKQDASFLARGSRLAQFESWAKETKLALTGTERSFLDTSSAQHLQDEKAEVERKAHEKVLERRSVTFLRGLVAVLVLATLGAFGLTGVALNQSQIARQNAAESQNVSLVAGSQAALANGNTDQAIALALQAVTLDPNSARAQAALSEAAYRPGTIRVFVGHTDNVDSLALSPDGRTALSASWDKTVILWDIQTAKILHHYEGHSDHATSVAFMPDGLTAISGSEDKTLIQWDLQTGKIIRRFEGQPDLIWALAISPDGLHVASGGSKGNIFLWDIQTGEISRHFEGHTAGIQRIRFSADGSKLVSASDDKMVILWGVETGQMIHRFEGHTSSVFGVVFSPDNSMILSGSDDSLMILWDIKTGQIIRRFYEGGPTIFDVAFSPDSRTILSAGIGGIGLWNSETAQPISRLRGHGGFVNAIVFSPDGRTALSASGDHTLRLWDLEEGQLIRRFYNQGSDWTDLAVSPDGHSVITAWHSDARTNISTWDINTGKEIRRYSTDEPIYHFALSPDGQMALSRTDHGDAPNDVILWNVVTGKEVRRFRGHPAAIDSVAFSPDGRTFASVGAKGIIILWDVATGQEIRRFKNNEGDTQNESIEWSYNRFSPNGQTLVASGNNAPLVVWDVATGQVIRHFKGQFGSVCNLAFSGNGQQAFSGSDDTTTILWDVATGSVLYRFRDHSGAIPQVDMTFDGHFGISGSTDGTTLVWNLTTHEAIRRYHPSATIPLFAPDHRTILVGIFLTNRIELWRFDATLDELLTWTRANRYIPELTCDQRALYHLEPLCGNDADLPTTAAG